MRVLTKRVRLELRDFHCKVALYFSYMHIKVDDEIQRDSLALWPQSRTGSFSTFAPYLESAR